MTYASSLSEVLELIAVKGVFSKFLKNKIKKKGSFYKNHDLIIDSGLFDESFYTNIVGSTLPYKTPLAHFLSIGHAQKLPPCPYFSTAFYLSQNADVKKAGVNTLVHYINYGEAEGRWPNPYFNPRCYLELNPDLVRFDKTLLLHYIRFGRNEGRRFIQSDSIDKNLSNHRYNEWISENENEPFQSIKSGLDSFFHWPLISIIVPVYNTDELLLIDCIGSVLAQSYSNWELCLVDDKSTNPYVKKILKAYASKDKRIKTVYRTENGHISAASNSALENTSGEWIALLDHDDKLHQHALFYIVKTINEQPNVELIYTDEDKIDLTGKRIEPHFKSSWNLDLLYSQNYVSHLGVYKSDIVKKIGGFRLGYEGSQDFDLLLRYSREINHENIVHIPKILYHWRMIEGSTALSANEKSYTTNAGIKALEDHFTALGQPTKVSMGKHDNIYKVDWEIIGKPLVSLIIPTYNGYEITKQAIDSILDKSTYTHFEILLIDNNSNDETALAYFEEINQHEKVRVLRYPYQFNYSAINNFAAKQAKGEIIGLINNDIEVITPDWLTEMISHAQREDIGCVGAMLYYANDTIQHAGVIIGIGGVAGHSHKYFKRGEHGYFSRLNVVQNLSAVTAACLLVRKSVFDEINGLNEDDLTVAFNDIDFCLKVQAAGYRNLWTPYAELYHHESISRGAEDNPEKIARFNREIDYMVNTWQNKLTHDPYYSPHLTLEREDFSIR